MYNSVLKFTSLSAKVDESVTRGTRPYSFHIQGEFYHKIGSLCPTEGQCPQFAQLYIHDTKCEHQNRHAVMPSLDPTTLDRLLTMMHNINPYVEVFKMARDMMAIEGAPMDLKLRFIASRTKDARRYNVPTANEVATLMVGNVCVFDSTYYKITTTNYISKISLYTTLLGSFWGNLFSLFQPEIYFFYTF